MANSTKGSVLAGLIGERSWVDVLSRLESHPSEASEVITKGTGESLPLYEACKLQPPASVIEALICAHEPGISTEGPFSFLPLHCAVRSNSVDAVAPLLKAYPRAARLKDGSGELPLHLACQWGASPEVVENLLTLYPEALYVRDNKGRTPMDYVKENKACGNENGKVVAIMERGTVFCAVSKAAYIRAKEEFGELLKGTTDAHNIHVTRMEESHSEQIELHRQLEEGLRSSLKHAGLKLSSLEKKNQDLVKERKHLKQELRILENSEKALQAQADLLERQLIAKSAEAQDEGIALSKEQECSEALFCSLDEVNCRNLRQSEQIEKLNNTVLSLSASISALSVPQESVQRAMVEQAKALRMVLGDRDGLLEEITHQKEELLNSTLKVEAMVLSASLQPTGGTVWEHDENIFPSDSPSFGKDHESKEVKCEDSGEEKSTVASTASVSSFVHEEIFTHVQHDGCAEGSSDEDQKSEDVAENGDNINAMEEDGMKENEVAATEEATQLIL